ncbi:hypothetical protein [Streptomyces sp. NBC_01262]|jgi:hypothetical protein|uniref:hypothetical protein n=1 Tax=Streptomyces sp. NBC_01262 TaxID=2903803 RepID=UPI002E37CD08|nr:hypothetical protein [Streptomyces sp. NBC_01262]
MNQNLPLGTASPRTSPSAGPSTGPRTLDHLSRNRRRVMTERQLREHGVTAGDLAERCGPEGPWQLLLPQVYLLHAGPPTSEERIEAALLYADGQGEGGDVMITGLAALALHRFSCVPPLLGLDRIDLLVASRRRLRGAGEVAIHRAHVLPRPQEVAGVPCAPVPRALADAVAELDDPETVRRLLTEAVRGGHCEAAAVVRELSQARLLSRPHVVEAVDTLLAEGRAIAESRLYDMVRCFGLPDPVWNVDLRLPGGPHLGGVDAYWPEHAVAVEIDARAPRQEEDALWSEYARKREHLERLGITVVHITPKKLRESLEQQAAVVRTALMASSDRTPAAYVVVLPS